MEEIINKYWNHHTVNSIPFKNKEESLDYLKYRSSIYPLFDQICLKNYSIAEGCEIIIDYGCGPGNDVIGFAHFRRDIKKIIAIDVSEKALELAKTRLELHEDLDKSKVNFILLNNNEYINPTFLEDKIKTESVDYIQSIGVLMMNPNYKNILKEFNRVLKINRMCTTMIYNKDSIWYPSLLWVCN